VTLRATLLSDLERLFAFQRERDAYWMAGFTATDPNDRDAYLDIWARIRADPRTIMRTILVAGEIAGDILSHEGELGKPEVGYWLGQEYWGQGIATRALRLFLGEMTRRPLYARAIKDNDASLGVLRKCGFTITGEVREYANARDMEVELYTLTLEAAPEAAAVSLRDLEDGDLETLYQQQLDPEANRMAAFTTKDPADRDRFMAHWARIRADPTNVIQTVLADGQIAGSVSSYQEEPGKPEVTYWLGREFWGRGIATRALALFLADHQPARPVYARAAKDNAGSLAVLAKNGFTVIGDGSGYANARGVETEEFELRRDA
jgi:RimJ/RimL family protein N-acetyltransferase